MTRIKDQTLIKSKKCQEKGCKKFAYAIIKAKFLCEYHFREIKPSKEGGYRIRTKGLVGKIQI